MTTITFCATDGEVKVPSDEWQRSSTWLRNMIADTNEDVVVIPMPMACVRHLTFLNRLCNWVFSSASRTHLVSTGTLEDATGAVLQMFQQCFDCERKETHTMDAPPDLESDISDTTTSSASQSDEETMDETEDNDFVNLEILETAQHPPRNDDILQDCCRLWDLYIFMQIDCDKLEWALLEVWKWCLQNNVHTFEDVDVVKQLVYFPTPKQTIDLCKSLWCSEDMIQHMSVDDLAKHVGVSKQLLDIPQEDLIQALTKRPLRLVELTHTQLALVQDKWMRTCPQYEVFRKMADCFMNHCTMLVDNKTPKEISYWCGKMTSEMLEEFKLIKWD